MTVTFDMDSPERGWQPFVDWLASLNLNPSDVRRVTILTTVDIQDSWEPWEVGSADPMPMAEVELIAYDRDGNRAIDAFRSEVCTYTRVGRVKPPPLHPSRSEAT